MLNDQMVEGSSIREHVMLKHSLVGLLQHAGFLVGFSTFVDAVVTSLPSWWRDGVADIVTRKKPLNNEELIVILEETEEEAIFNTTLDAYEAGESSSDSHVACSLGDDRT